MKVKEANKLIEKIDNEVKILQKFNCLVQQNVNKLPKMFV